MARRGQRFVIYASAALLVVASIGFLFSVPPSPPLSTGGDQQVSTELQQSRVAIQPLDTGAAGNVPADCEKAAVDAPQPSSSFPIEAHDERFRRWAMQLTTHAVATRAFEPFRPKAIAAEYDAARRRSNGRESSDLRPSPFDESNSVPISADDLMRAERNIVAPLPEAAPIYVAKSEGNVHTKDRVAVALFNAFRHGIQRLGGSDAWPTIVDVGCTLGPVVANAHPNASVFCVVANEDVPGDRNEDTDAAQSSVTSRLDAIRQSVHRWAQQRGGNEGGRNFVVLQQTPQFEPFFKSCNTISIAVLLDRLKPPFLRGQRSPSPSRAKGDDEGGAAEQMRRLRQLLNMTLFTVAAVTRRELRTLVRESALGNFQVTILGDASPWQLRGEGSIEDNTTRCHTLVIVGIQVRRASRACAKTWDAPLMQWDRRQVVSVHNGIVSFRVEAASANSNNRKQKEEEKGGTKKKMSGIGRVIPLLQYMPSLNLDTVLGAGVDEATRMRFLGAMLATARYSDPLPHNWVIAHGGLPVRIDRVDERYDRDVDETKGYWGVSTHGYVRLLAHHLCLPLGPDGLPALFRQLAGRRAPVNVASFGPLTLPTSIAERITANPNDRRPLATLEGSGTGDCCCHVCMACIDECSYLPKGRIPCDACLRCGLCVTQLSDDVASLAQPASSCRRAYTSMHAARKVWKGWQSEYLQYVKRNPLKHTPDSRCQIVP